ncbi:hypothetical protein P7C71_g1321, partial [Lecanoromycetidae sp. Uapishka_2]
MLRSSLHKSGSSLLRGSYPLRRTACPSARLRICTTSLAQVSGYPSLFQRQQKRSYAVAAEDTNKGVVYFRNMEDGNMPMSQAFQPPPTIVPTPAGGVPQTMPDAGVAAEEGSDVTNHLKVQLLVRAYQARGHHKAKTDPLGIRGEAEAFGYHRPKELELDHYQFTEKDLDMEYKLGPGILPRFQTAGREKMTLREIVATCERLYCGSYGIEYIHIPDREQCDWIRNRTEIPSPYKYSVDEKQGGETLVPGMKALIDRSVDFGVKDIIIGMPHRGRLNVLSNVVRKPNESIFSEFGGSAEPSDEGSGDVKYHLGMNFERPTPSGKRVQLSLVANPSHLEAEDPVVLGKTRAIQHYNQDEKNFTSAMGVLLHGDAAFAAQGIVYETMGFHALPAYSTGGTIHLIINNQIGFTTDPRFARSTPYCSDIAKSIDAPVFHVNGDDVEAVNFVCQMAADWRAEFKKDVVVDIVCYRKQGHNETDQPSFTQPLMYKKINQQKPAVDKYEEKLLQEKSFTKDDIDEHKKWVWGMLSNSFDASKDYQPTSKEWLTSAWNGFKSPKELATEILPHLPTGVPVDTLKHIGEKIGNAPDGFNVHKNLKRILAGRTKTVNEGKNIDWSTAEALAFGTLCNEGHHVRVSGQDVERGTFSQRHAVIHDQESESTYTPLQHISDKQGSFIITNSSLSEFGVLGFEYGYSLSSPNALVIWEAQFGDFANNCQCIIDQFVASGEVKWLQRSGLVMSLPHGYDGQGPEHSSGRMERYLQLCNEDPRIFPSPDKLDRQHQDCNMQIAYMTTPSNLFHILRRQMNRQFRKPHEDNTIAAPEEIDRVILCTGQGYVALHKHRKEHKLNSVAITRIEQLNPFPWQQLKENLDMYPNAKTIVWAQEEPLNAGAWSFTQPRIETLLNNTEHHDRKHVMYAGRNPSASVATGLKGTHLKEELDMLEMAFGVTQEKLKGE